MILSRHDSVNSASTAAPSLLSVAHIGLVEISVPPLSSSLFVISVFSRGNPPFAGGKVSGSAQFGFSVLGVFRGLQVGFSWSWCPSFTYAELRISKRTKRDDSSLRGAPTRRGGRKTEGVKKRNSPQFTQFTVIYRYLAILPPA